MGDRTDTTVLRRTRALRRFADDKMQKVNLFATERMFCDIYCLRPGQAQKVHAHSGADKIYVVLAGTATVRVGDETFQADVEDAVLAPSGVPHGVRNDSDRELVCLVFMAPNPNV